MGPNIGVCPITAQASGEVQPQTFVGPDGATAAAAGNSIGVAPNYAKDEPMAVDHLGLVTVVAGAAIAAGAEVEVGANGRAVTLAAGVKVARVHPEDSAAADGDRIRVFLIPN